MSLGTDTNPQSVIEAMRWAAVCSKVVERNTEITTAAHAFDAATLGGARALGRDDLGRIAPGAKADLVLWKTASWRMTPLRDPIKNIVYNATDEDVDRVYVNGRLVVDGGKVLAADDRALMGRLAVEAVEAGVGAVLVLDLGRVGTGGGVDLRLLATLRRAVASTELLAGGGVRTRRDLERMRDLGCDGVLVATALHAGEVGAADLAALEADPQSDANASR